MTEHCRLSRAVPTINICHDLVRIASSKLLRLMHSSGAIESSCRQVFASKILFDEKANSYHDTLNESMLKKTGNSHGFSVLRVRKKSSIARNPN